MDLISASTLCRVEGGLGVEEALQVKMRFSALLNQLDLLTAPRFSGLKSRLDTHFLCLATGSAGSVLALVPGVTLPVFIASSIQRIMGSCCSKGRALSVTNSPSFARITDSILQMRTPTVELQEETVELLVEEKMEEAYQWHLNSVKALLDWKEPALKSEEFEESMGKLLELAKNYFRALFMQGTTGENVPFNYIETSEKSLMQFCKSDFALFRYCNVFKSFTVCSNLKRELVKNYSSGQAKLLKFYDRSAQGPYAKRCRKDLEHLLTLLGRCTSKQEVTCKLEAQLAMDQEILAAKLAKAQEKARTQMSEVFDDCGEGQLDKSPVTMSMLQSHASVMDVISRVIESAPESSNQSYVLSGALGSLRDPYSLKKHSSEVPAKREDSVDGSSSLQSEINSPLRVEISHQSRVMCMDRGLLHKLG